MLQYRPILGAGPGAGCNGDILVREIVIRVYIQWWLRHLADSLANIKARRSYWYNHRETSFSRILNSERYFVLVDCWDMLGFIVSCLTWQLLKSAKMYVECIIYYLFKYKLVLCKECIQKCESNKECLVSSPLLWPDSSASFLSVKEIRMWVGVSVCCGRYQDGGDSRSSPDTLTLTLRGEHSMSIVVESNICIGDNFKKYSVLPHCLTQPSLNPRVRQEDLIFMLQYLMTRQLPEEDNKRFNVHKKRKSTGTCK